MIALLLYSLLFVFGLLYTLISAFPSTMKFLAPSGDRKAAPPPPQDPIKPAAAPPIGGLRGVFATFDKDDDGYITKKELRESLEKIGIAAGERDIEDMVQKVDANGDGLIDFGEFCELYESIDGGSVAEAEAEAQGGDGDLREAFDVFDGNKDGLITVEELGLVLSSLGFNEGKKLEACKEMIRKVDVDGDGMVNFDEFKKMMKDGLGRLIAVS